MATAKNWLITGVSSGFGLALAQAALARGDHVSGTVRQPRQLAAFEALAPGRARAYRLDVTEPAAVSAVIAQIVQDADRIDVVVNNAAYGQIGTAEEVSEGEARRLFDTNFFGPLAVVRAVLPQLRAQRSGHVINISSAAGSIGVPGMALYSASKFALEGLSEALAAEAGAFGIRVTIVEPGGFRTDFAGRSINSCDRVLPDYADTSGKVRSALAQQDGHQPGDPAKAARAMLQLADSPSPPLRLVLGSAALVRLREHLARVSKDYDDWQAISIATDY